MPLFSRKSNGSMPMLAKAARGPMHLNPLMAVIAGALMMLTTTDSLAGRVKTNNGPPSRTATIPGPINDVRDHRGQRSGPPPPKPPHRRCGANPYSGKLENCSGVTIRDHR
jgi:hypothetical protein